LNHVQKARLKLAVKIGEKGIAARQANKRHAAKKMNAETLGRESAGMPDIMGPDISKTRVLKVFAG
jgi:hypothetical protein